MIYSYKGSYSYDKDVVGNWDSNAIGVYYCGFLNSNKGLIPLYIGLGTGEKGMKGRLLDHLRDDHWPEVTHFGYQVCDSVKEAEEWEVKEIAIFKPKYNTVGK